MQSGLKQKLEEAIQQLLISRQATLALAESCTGGAISARLVQIPGASAYFLGAITSYSNQSKEEILKVTPETLLTHGAVSRECVEEMVRGTLTLFHSTYAIAISGIAGPSGESEEKLVGTIWLAIGNNRHDVYTCCLHTQGSRQEIIRNAVNHALESFFLRIKNDPQF